MAIAEDYNFESLNIISGNLEVRLAENSLEIDAAQALRYRVFFEEMQAIPSIKQKKSKREFGRTLITKTFKKKNLLLKGLFKKGFEKVWMTIKFQNTVFETR